MAGQREQLMTCRRIPQHDRSSRDTRQANTVGADDQGFNTSTSLMLEVLHCRPVVIEMLISAGADVNVQPGAGNSLLMVASGTGCTDAVRVLLGAGADVNARNDSGDTALVMAKLKGHEEIVELLKAAGAKD